MANRDEMGGGEFSAAVQYLIEKSAPTAHLVVPEMPHPGNSAPTQHLVPPPAPSPAPDKK